MNAVNETPVSDIELLLPWHAAGTLSHRDSQRVETALANDPELARRFELVREELNEDIHLNETLGAPSARAMEALFAKIDAEPARTPPVTFNLGARVRDFFASLTPRTLAWSASAAAVAILLQAGLIAGIMIKENGAGATTGGGDYQTASVPSAFAGDGSYALIRFQPQANAADIAKFLEANNLSVTGGPITGALFRVQVAPTKLPTADLAGIVKKLQSDKLIVGFVAATQ
jgi:anti-sigma factor RsiW